MKTKKQLVEKILHEADIHHNITISWGKLPDYTEEDAFNPMDVAEYMLGDFKRGWEDWENNPTNDCGNRNIGRGCELKGEVWTTGRSGATLYWDAYWNERRGSISFRYSEDELNEMKVPELRAIYKDLCAFNEAVGGLMKNFYEECAYRLEEMRTEKKEQIREENDYQGILTEVKEKGYIKRLVSDLL